MSSEKKSGDKEVKVDDAAAKAKKAEPSRPLTPLEVLYRNIDRIQKAASLHDTTAVLRVLRFTPVVRHQLSLTKLSSTVELYISNAEERAQALAAVARLASALPDDVSMGAEAAAPAALEPPEASPPALVPAYATEVALYLQYIIVSLVAKRAAWEEVAAASKHFTDKISAANKRTLDVFGAKFWSFLSLAHEKLGTLASIRGELHDAHRSACLRHDELGQVTLLNLLVRNYLAFNLYDQAQKLISKASFPESVSNNQLVRFLYYKGRISAIQLDYSDALNTLTHADKKTPAVIAKGFRAQVKKFLIIVQLLLGEIPERSVFELEDLKATLQPYLALTQAVRLGDLAAFNAVLSSSEGVFKRDQAYSLILRLRQNVIKAGLRKIWLSYSRISFADIALKLHLESPEDAEFLCAKAIRDGVLEATLNHDEGYLSSKEVVDVYSTSEPQTAFDRRIKFCLSVHNDAVKSMSYPAPEQKDPAADLERVKEELALAEEVDGLDDMDDGDDL